MKLQELDGVGPKTAKLLSKAGYDTVGKLSKASTTNLAKIDGIGKKTAQDVVKKAETKLRSNRKATKKSPKKKIPKAPQFKSKNKTTKSKKSSKKTTKKKSSNKKAAKKSSRKASKPTKKNVKKQAKKALSNEDMMLETLATLHNRIIELELRVRMIEMQNHEDLPKHIKELKKYIKLYLHSWSEDRIHEYLGKHGHSEADIRRAILLSRQ